MPHYVIDPRNGTAIYNPKSTSPDPLSLLPSSEALFNTKIRYEPGNRIRISCFSRPIYNPAGFEEVKKPYSGLADVLSKVWNPFTGRWEACEDCYALSFEEFLHPPEAKPVEIRDDSRKRSKDKAFEIGLANDFRYFITLTLDKDKIDRYDKDVIYPKLKNWLSNRVSRNQMDYLLFPEYHKLKEGEERPAIHFHLLANAEGLECVPSGRSTKHGQPVYNLPGWPYGFSTLIELDGKPAIIRYVTKYISKDNHRILGRFYLSGGKTLKRALPCEYMNCDYISFEGQEYHVPEAHLSVKYRTYDLDIPGEDEDEEAELHE